MLFICGSLIPGHFDDKPEPSAATVVPTFLAPGWTIKEIRELPAKVTSLVSIHDRDEDAEFIYVGTGGAGGVYRLYEGRDIVLPAARTIATSLGDRASFSDCQVNRLAIFDLDQDGVDELIAETSQILPRGRPRVYVWSLVEPIVPRAFARPEMESSWGHGIGFLKGPGPQSTRLFSTYCGFGEVLEYRLFSETTSDGFAQETIGWRNIGQLPASGEGIQLCDANNDGTVDLCLGTGYQFNSAALLLYEIPEGGALGEPKTVINENNRFGTVKFIIGSPSSDYPNELFVWWCTGLGDGDTELYRYRLGPSGLESRDLIMSGSSDDIWPIDGQMALADVDQDGMKELWFATAKGNLWMFSATTDSTPQLVCQLPTGIGPIAHGGYLSKSVLYIGAEKHVLQLRTDR